MEHYYRIPRYLDHPKLYPVFTLGETLILSVPIIIGWLAMQSVWGLIAGFLFGAIAFKNFKKFKEDYGEYAIRRYIYWYFPSHWCLPFTYLKAFPISSTREYIG